jgi:hypothetical protein
MNPFTILREKHQQHVAQTAAREQARAQIDTLFGQVQDLLATPGFDRAAMLSLRTRILELAAQAGSTPADLQQRRNTAFVHALANRLNIQRLTLEQERALIGYASVWGNLAREWPALTADYQARLVIARANANRLRPWAGASDVILHPGEFAYIAIPAQLAKQVVDREWRGGSTGVSVRVTRGVWPQRAVARTIRRDRQPLRSGRHRHADRHQRAHPVHRCSDHHRSTPPETGPR